MNEHALFTAALGLAEPWKVTDIRFEPEAGRIDFDVEFKTGSRFSCPACEAHGQAVHDTRSRSWRHLHFFQYQAYIHAALPRVHCNHCGKTTQVTPPWARPGSGFSLLFEALVITLCRQMPVNTVARLLGVGDDALWRILRHYVDQAREQADFSTVQAVGIDETAARRGHHYISLFHDLDGQRLLFACEGRDQQTVAGFVEDLRDHGGDPDRVTAACIDMSKAYIAGVAQHLPQAQVTFDRFHIIQLAQQALDQVRRQEVRDEPLLRRTRWIWLKDARRWTMGQLTEFHHLSRTRLKTPRAWRLVTTLREIFATARSVEEAEPLLKSWYSWARRCRLEPMKRLAATLKAHWQGVLNEFDSCLNNGRVEGINSLIQAAKARARGYRTPRSLITMAYLIAGKLEHLPASPYTSAAAPGR